MRCKKKDNIKFGYVRVSTKDQNEGRQPEAMKKMGLSERDIFMDKQSGEDFEISISIEITAVKAMEEIGLKKTTFYKLVREYEELL